MFADQNRRLITAIAGVFAIGAVLFAWLYLEKTLYLAPCPLCMTQRLAFFLAGIFFIFDAIVWNSSFVLRLIASIGKFGGIFLGIGLAARHLMILYAPDDKKPSDCGFDFYALLEKEGFWPGILKSMKGTGDCASVDPYAGLPVPVWSMILFVLLLLAAVLFGKVKK